MELNKLIPLKFIPNIDCEWVVKGKYLMYRRYEHIPMAYIEDDIVYIFLENKIPNQVLKLTKWVANLGVEFYFADPEFSNPSGIENYHRDTIYHYLHSYAQKHFFKGFKDIEFDLIKNMVDWCTKEGCTELIKDVYSKINTRIQKGYFDYYSGKDIYEYKNEIREEFRTLYRDIQINQII